METVTYTRMNKKQLVALLEERDAQLQDAQASVEVLKTQAELSADLVGSLQGYLERAKAKVEELEAAAKDTAIVGDEAKASFTDFLGRDPTDPLWESLHVSLKDGIFRCSFENEFYQTSRDACHDYLGRLSQVCRKKGAKTRFPSGYLEVVVRS